MQKKEYANTRLRSFERNKRERRVLQDSLSAYISNMGTDHDNLITKLIRSKNILFHNIKGYRKDYTKLCTKHPLPSCQNTFRMMAE